MKTCSKCNQDKEDNNFYKHSRICKSCKNENLRIYRQKNDNICTKKYEKTKQGFLVRMYRNMQSRINGIQKRHYHLYKGKDLILKEDFYNYALNNPRFHELFKTWEENNYQRKIAPSIDRIDSKFGYSLDNIQFITFSENCAKTSRLKNK